MNRVQGNISISRDSSHLISIEVRDGNAKSRAFTLLVEPAEFAMALTGMGRTGCIIDFGDLTRLGKVRISEERSTVCHLTGHRTANQFRDWLECNCQEEGWELDSYLGAQSSIKYLQEGGVTLRYRVRKWVDYRDAPDAKP